MSDIRTYLKNKYNNQAEKEEYQKKIAAHKRKVRCTIAAIMAVIIVIMIVINIYMKNRSFDEYEVVDTIQTNMAVGSRYYGYADCMLAYSDDGISYIKEGETVWNQAFEMKEPLVDICKTTVAICDLQSTVVYIYNSEGQQGKIETMYPIIDLEVSEQGVIAAITKDMETNRIEIFDKDGNSIAVGQTYVTGEGCPVDISLSNDGTKLAVSYVYIDGVSAKSKVVFYNYSEVGKNEVSRIVGGFNHYDTSLVAKVEFLDNDTVAVFAENMFTIYSIKQKPEIVYEQKLGERIKSIFYNESHVGMILSSEDYDNPYIIKIYDTEGNEEASETSDFMYTGIEFKDDSIVLYNAENMLLMTTGGRIRYKGTIAEEIIEVIAGNKDNEYYIVNGEHNIMKISLK